MGESPAAGTILAEQEDIDTIECLWSSLQTFPLLHTDVAAAKRILRIAILTDVAAAIKDTQDCHSHSMIP